MTQRASAPAGARPRANLRLPNPVLLFILGVGVVLAVVAALFARGVIAVGPAAEPPTATATATSTVPPTFTYTPTATETPAPTDTPLPPAEYTVVSGDTCLLIAANHDVSYQSIIALNGLDPNCTLTVGQKLLIPQPTLTPTPLPTATLNSNVATQVQRTTYTVQAGDTLQGIARFYGISVVDLMEVNGLTDANSIREGQVLIIPLERVVTPGPTPTPTLPPPWPAPNPLLPDDGQIFSVGDATITLQWASVGALRPDEFYAVTVEDVTCNCARFYRQVTTETKLIVPTTFRPPESVTRVFRWAVTTVRMKPGTSAQPEYDSAGATSPNRVFTWVGGATPAP